ncbi:MAG: hypothetical protein ACXABY_02585 [Candidatus Thorarchaeota archaeon]|jgi:hypothetical protein
MTLTILLDHERSAVKRLQPVQSELVRLLDGCRVDMHEPDEQDVEAVVVGTHLDNAIGTGFGPPQWHDTTAELAVGITRYKDGVGRETRWFNLADLLAIARLADLRIEEE